MKARPLALIPQYFGSLVYDQRTHRYLPFDQPATSLLRQLAQEPPGPDTPCEFLRRFHGYGFWDWQGLFDGVVLNLTPPHGHLAGPLTVHLEVAARCNLSCGHCFAGSLPRAEAPLTLSELDRLFQELVSMGCFRLGITGGEPLLRRDLLDILDLALERGLQPGLTTNGLLLSEELCRQLGRRRLVWLNVSLDGATAESNDAIRGSGTFERVLKRLAVLRRHAEFSLAFTVTADNAQEVKECCQLAKEVGASAAVFRPLYPVGKASANLQLMPSFEQYSRAVETLGDGDPFGSAGERQRVATLYTGGGCGAANLICSVSLGGRVNPCSYLGPEFDSDNLRQRSFGEIWNRGQTFLALRGQQSEDFQGGCRARAQALNGSARASDPWHQQFLRGGPQFHPNMNWEV
ncbi:MAG: radical SAM protein [Vulcanimicrobiota bacterium]